ncbi:MAG: hypothetical protein ACJ749_16770 [Flavisolibacter sp.]|jgi:hypothetical protein
MKIPLFLSVMATLSYCTPTTEIQMSVIDVELVKIDTVDRFRATSHLVYTWRGENKVDYVTFEPITRKYSIGSWSKVMVKR